MPEALTIDAPAAPPDEDVLNPVTPPSAPPRRRRLRRPALPIRRRTVFCLVGLALLGIVLLIAFTGSTHKRTAGRSGHVHPSSLPGVGISPANAPVGHAGSSAPIATGKQPPVQGSPIGSGAPAPQVPHLPSGPAFTPSGGAPASTPESSPSSRPAPATTHPATTPVPTPPPVMHTYTTYGVGVLFGTTAANLRAVKPAPRFSTFPAVRHPVVTFLGLSGDARTAQFLVYGRPHSVGDGSCRPSADACVLLSMRPGDKELITMQRADGATTRYGLAYTSVVRGHVRASAAPDAPVSAAGQWLIDLVAGRALPQLASLKYSAGGLLLTHLKLPSQAS